MLPRCVMPAGQAIAQLNCVDWIVKAIHLFILFQGNWTDEITQGICMAIKLSSSLHGNTAGTCKPRKHRYIM